MEPAPGPSEDAEAAEPLQSDPPGWDATVLVIEDNDDMRAYLGELLAPRYHCLLAADGEQGLRLATEESPDLVVSDVMLPGQDGYQVCRALKSDERTSHIPVILLTALDGEQDKLKGLRERADDYLTKPFDEDEVKRRIQNLLEIRNLLQRRYARELRFDQHPPAELNERDQRFLAKLSSATAVRHGDPEFGPPLLARALAVSERQLQRKLKALTGLTPAEFVRGYRLQQALERLQAGERPSEVAYAVGFGSQAYFSTCFKAQFGYTPGEARERRAAEPEMTT
jgi:CheY-like chemotaxis protein